MKVSDVSVISAAEKGKKDSEVEKQVTSLVKYRKGKIHKDGFAFPCLIACKSFEGITPSSIASLFL